MISPDIRQEKITLPDFRGIDSHIELERGRFNDINRILPSRKIPVKLKGELKTARLITPAINAEKYLDIDIPSPCIAAVKRQIRTEQYSRPPKNIIKDIEEDFKKRPTTIDISNLVF